MTNTFLLSAAADSQITHGMLRIKKSEHQNFQLFTDFSLFSRSLSQRQFRNRLPNPNYNYSRFSIDYSDPEAPSMYGPIINPFLVQFRIS